MRTECDFNSNFYDGVTFKVVRFIVWIKPIDLFTDTAAILNSEEIMGCPGGR